MTSQLLTFIGIAAPLVLVVLFGPTLWGWARKLIAGGSTASISTRGAQLQRLADCADWFEAEGCQEGLDLIAQATPHAVHAHKEPTA